MLTGAPELVTGSRDGLVKVWDPRQKGDPVATMEPGEGEAKRDCWAVAFGNCHILVCGIHMSSSCSYRRIHSGNAYNLGNMVGFMQVSLSFSIELCQGLCFCVSIFSG